MPNHSLANFIENVIARGSYIFLLRKKSTIICIVVHIWKRLDFDWFQCLESKTLQSIYSTENLLNRQNDYIISGGAELGGSGGTCPHVLGIYLVNFGSFWKFIFHYLLLPPHKKFASAHPVSFCVKESGNEALTLREQSSTSGKTLMEIFSLDIKGNVPVQARSLQEHLFRTE